MMLGEEVRAADAAMWRLEDVGPSTPGLRRVPPVLAVEIAGKDEPLESLLEKATWYLDRGVEVVWILVPSTEKAVVRTTAGTTEVRAEERLPPHPSLPGLTPRVSDLFRFLRRR
jgi:Uma2 family endonuclease